MIKFLFVYFRNVESISENLSQFAFIMCLNIIFKYVFYAAFILMLFCDFILFL